MKKSELENLIRDIVQEEVRNAMPVILMEVANAITGKKPFLKESTKSAPVAKPTVQRTQPKPQVITERKFSSNPLINQILSETEGGISYDDPSSYPNTMMSEGVEMPGGEVEEVGVSTTNFLKKDYRSFLKKMDKSAQNSRPM